MDVPAWIKSVYSLKADLKIDDAMDCLSNNIDDRLLDGKFDEVNEALTIFDPECLCIDLMVGLLTITLAAGDKLFARSKMVARIEGQLKCLDPSRVEGLLKGLR